MAQFEWLTRRIDLRERAQTRWTTADLKTIPEDENLALTLAHEFVHYRQIVSSLPGLRLLADLVSFSVKGAIVLSDVPLKNGKASGYHRILSMLRKLPDAAGEENPDLLERGTKTLDEADVLMGAHSFPYSGAKNPWEIDVHRVEWKSFVEEMHGIVVPRAYGEKAFRPLSPGLLAEVMARRIDRWICSSHGFTHRWSPGEVEDEHYNGLVRVLSHGRFEDAVDGENIDQLAVVLAHLALATPRPDLSAAIMLQVLEEKGFDRREPTRTANRLKAALVAKGQLSASHYNKVMDDLAGGDAQVMSRAEYWDIYEHMQRIHFAANALLDCPDYYADNTVDWPRVRAWMSRGGVPPVVCDDGVATEVAGVECEQTVTPLLMEMQRVLLPRVEPA